MKKFNIAVVGATGNVGREILNVLAEREFPIDNIYALASRDSIGKEVSFGEKTLKISALDHFDFTKVDIVLSSAGSGVSEVFAPKAAEAGAVIIDNTSYFRMHKDVPLIVPEVNPNALKDYKKTNIIANPNCCVIPLAVALKPLDNAAKIKRIVVSTYQSVSGAGKEAMDELYGQTKNMFLYNDIIPKAFGRQIAFNLIPQIGSFGEDNYTDEEHKIAGEMKKIMGDHVRVTATCVRVPVFVGHSLSVNVEFEKSLSANEAYELLSEAEGLRVLLPEQELNFITPVEVVGDDEVYVSRIREDHSQKNTLNMWLVSDNVRKGAALNAVQIAEMLINEYFPSRALK
ncbi:MAG: aspartate-semialdehyde dehydrogenase [Rickettsiaceae bacterium]|jgi:aspartate-semialdehyde dehydrogenase|nr:aspartate-semialdehyde dehydrogenase [Rickettsiaceae bacterium]